MTFDQADVLMHQGQAVRLKKWPDGHRIFRVKHGKSLVDDTPVQLLGEPIRDWKPEFIALKTKTGSTLYWSLQDDLDYVRASMTEWEAV